MRLRHPIRSTATRTRSALLAALAVALGLTLSGTLLSAPAYAAEPGHARQLHGTGLRPVRGAEPGRDDRVAQELAVPRRRASTSPVTPVPASARPT